MTPYTFTPANWTLCEEVARARTDRAEHLGAGHGEAASYFASYKRNLVGAVGECAYARVTFQRWPNDENDFGAVGDFPGGEEIRTTVHPAGSLIIFEGERLARPFVLVAVELQQKRATVCGWILGTEAAAVWEDPGPRIRPGSKPQKWVRQHYLNAQFRTVSGRKGIQ